MDFLSDDGLADLLIVESKTAEQNFKWFASLLEGLGLLESSIENARIELAQKTVPLSIAEQRVALAPKKSEAQEDPCLAR